ncbi:hypothetical protein E2320_004902, partial [Naja naja]
LLCALLVFDEIDFCALFSCRDLFPCLFSFSDVGSYTVTWEVLKRKMQESSPATASRTAWASDAREKLNPLSQQLKWLQARYVATLRSCQALQKYSEDYLNSDHRAKADPSSGPRLITCRKYNYLRPGYDQRIHEIRDFYPDLENDDLFVRKTGASHANPVVLQDFEYLRRSCQPRPRIEGEIVLQPRDEEDETIPDLEKDDLTVRKAQLHKKEVPLSGAPDKYQPALFPDPWTLPPEIQAKFLCLLEKSTLKSECEQKGKSYLLLQGKRRTIC